MRASRHGLVVGLAVAFAMTACASADAPPDAGAGPETVALGTGEIWESEQKPPDDYRRCLTAALLRYDAAESSVSALVSRSQDACGSEADEWREAMVSQGEDRSGRRWYMMRYSEHILIVAAELRIAVQDYRMRKVPLTELAERM